MHKTQWHDCCRPKLSTAEIKLRCDVYTLRDTLAMCRRDLHRLEGEGKVRRWQNGNGPAAWEVVR
jgi:hypothetical protein